MRKDELTSPVKRAATPAVAFSLVGIAVLLWFVLPLDAAPKAFPDNYLIRARWSLLEPIFYTYDRPFMTSLFYKLWRYTPAWIVLGQHVLSLAAWSTLGVVIASRVSATGWKLAVFWLFALAATSRPIGGWNVCLLSESLSLSFLALFVAALIRLYHRPSILGSMALALAAALLALTRDQMAYFVPACAWLMVPFTFLYRKEQPGRMTHFLVFAGFATVLFLFASHTSRIGKRHQFPLLNVFCQRVIEDPEHTDWFRQRGAPIDALIDARHDWRGEWASSHDWALYREPEYQSFRTWVVEEGRGAIGLFLLSHPIYTFRTVWEARGRILRPDLSGYTGRGPQTIVNRLATSLWKPFSNWVWLVIVVGYGVMVFSHRLEPMPIVMVAAALAIGILVFHADAMEVERHSLSVGVAVQLAVWIMLVGMLPPLWRAARARLKQARSESG